MNYFEHHIGDYDEATSHLTACEDGIYCRLIRKYMAKEQPLPDDLPALQRLVRARTREEKSAVASILTEFFYLADGFWHQKTCDEAIEKFRSGEPEREVKKANEENRLKRHREERAALFRALTEAGEHAPWNIPMGELRELVKRVTATAPETPQPPLPETAPATPATATQTPLTTTQTPLTTTQTPLTTTQTPNTKDNPQVKSKEAPAALELPDWLPEDAWNAFVAMRKKIKAPLTDDAVKLAIDKLGELMQSGHRPRAVLEQSTLNSWRGLFEIKTGQRSSNDADSRQAFNERENAKAKQMLFGPEVDHAA